MRHWARFLHVTLLALALAMLALPLTSHASVRADNVAPPAPFVIAIDPGHGGAPNNARPDLGYDAGAVGVDGTYEKDLTLEVAKRLRTQLESDMVRVVLTREDDRDVSIEQRSAIVNDSGALLYVSIHFNSFTDPGVGGSLVLYPGAKDAAFAKVMDSRLAAHLAGHGIGDGGPQLRDNWWIHVVPPTVTVEPAYMSNPKEERFLTSSAGKDDVARAIRDGIETYKPEILTRKQEILAAHAQADGGGTGTAPDAAPAVITRDSGGTVVLHWLMLFALAAVAVHWRRPLWKVSLLLARGAGWLLQRTLVKRNARRRRRRQVRQRSVAAHSARLARPHSVYDELFL